MTIRKIEQTDTKATYVITVYGKCEHIHHIMRRTNNSNGNDDDHCHDTMLSDNSDDDGSA